MNRCENASLETTIPPIGEIMPCYFACSGLILHPTGPFLKSFNFSELVIGGFGLY